MALNHDLLNGEVELYGINPEQFDFYSEMYHQIFTGKSNYDLAMIVEEYESREHSQEDHTEDFAKYSAAVDILQNRVGGLSLDSVVEDRNCEVVDMLSANSRLKKVSGGN